MFDRPLVVFLTLKRFDQGRPPIDHVCNQFGDRMDPRRWLLKRLLFGHIFQLLQKGVTKPSAGVIGLYQLPNVGLCFDVDCGLIKFRI